MAARKPVSFFDKYAEEYDWLTDAGNRIAAHRKEVDALIARFSPTRVLDAGCATGLTASLFASKGVETIGLDRSRLMLAIAKRKYESANLPLSFRYGSFEALPSGLNNSSDLVVCLANSIVGVETIPNLNRSLRCFYRALRPGGYVVLQALNIDALSDEQVMPVRTTEHDGVLHTRFLERVGRRSILYILRVDKRIAPPRAEFFRNVSMSFTPDLLVEALAHAGFVNVRKHADLALTRRFSSKSRDIVISAQRPR